jgi:hypothetical protein
MNASVMFNRSKLWAALAAAAALTVSAGASAQVLVNPPTTVVPVKGDPVNARTVGQRDVNQQVRIENGLQSGSLSAAEAARLETTQTRVDQVQTKAASDGKITAGERERIDTAQDRASEQIYTEKHDDKTGHPYSSTSQAMQDTVQRDANQSQRIYNGVDNGSLTNIEAARLQQGQARVDERQTAAAADGRVTTREASRIDHAQDRQSARIYQQKHDGRERKNR